MMRGKQEQQITMLSSLTPDQLVPSYPADQAHCRPGAQRALADVQSDVRRRGETVDTSRAPAQGELIALYSIRSERQFCERLQYDLLFKWFLDLNIMDPAFDASSFSKNKERLLEHQVAREFLTAVVAEAPPPESAVGRPLQRRRHLVGGMGFAQEHSSEGWRAAAAG
jgi:hypothetical protein